MGVAATADSTSDRRNEGARVKGSEPSPVDQSLECWNSVGMRLGILPHQFEAVQEDGTDALEAAAGDQRAGVCVLLVG